MNKSLIKFFVPFIMSIPMVSLASTRNYIQVDLLDGKTFGYYDISQVTLRAKCDTKPYEHHTNLKSKGDISSKKEVYLDYKDCGKEPYKYELKFLTNSKKTYSCKTKKVQTATSPYTDTIIFRPEAVKIKKLSFKENNKVLCEWYYTY